MTRQQFKNLDGAFRAMRHQVGYVQALAWIRFHSFRDANIIFRIYG